MAFSANYYSNYATNEVGVHVVITNFLELSKQELCVNVTIWRTKSDYLAGMPAFDYRRFTLSISDLSMGVNPRTGIYTWLMAQDYFTNAVTDTDDDFPVTPIE